MFSATHYLQYLNNFSKIDSELLELLLSKMVMKNYKKGAIITSTGQIQRDLFLVEKGVQMSYLNRDGKMHIIAFTYPPSPSGIPDSFLSQQASQYDFQALTDSTFRAISYTALEELMQQHRAIETLIRKMTEHILAGFITRYVELHALSMEERYRVFVQRSPHLFQLIPHKYIANYLRISPTNFSKLYNSIKI